TISIDQGKIVHVGDTHSSSDISIDASSLSVSPGWVDLRAFGGEPGLEHKEDLTSLAKAAAFGGFTHVAIMPNTQPVIQTKDAIRSLVLRSQHSLVNFLPLAAASIDLKGESMTEAIDLKHAGAIAFSDGDKPIKNPALIVKLLQYLGQFDGLLMVKPEDKHLSAGGQMHEGISSTYLGLKGMPSMAENLQLQRDIELLKYAGGRLHVSGVSSEASVDLIRKAKKSGLNITCDIHFYQVVFDDSALSTFDTNHKVNPPYRTKKDIKALLKGLEDGTIDAIATGHQGQDVECKNLEFDLADFGMLGLETAFASLNTHITQGLGLELLLEKISSSPRKLLGLPAVSIQEGAMADLTLFHPTHTWTYTAQDIYSKSANTPFVGSRFVGKAMGIIRNGQYSFSPELVLHS
ncbi:MAG: dihydroorotase, partial [Cytophagales bacterium]|nr:dihydroorotase [Cytophagales bacterium]